MLRILASNDDGMHAPGLKVLESIARSISRDVWVVAPETEQSAASHSLTIHVPLRIREINARTFAVSGTPTDCVLLGARRIVPVKKKKIGLVLSGVNRGSNIGEDVTYSGTIAAAMEGTLLGIPSIALSQECRASSGAAPWAAAEKFAPGLIKKLIKHGWPRGTLMNVNFPDIPPAKVKGIRFAPQGTRKIGDKIEERKDPKGRAYYWIGDARSEEGDKPGSDVALLAAGYITVTPLALNLTDHATLKKMGGAFGR